MPRGTTLSVHILTRHGQNSSAVSVIQCLRKQVLHILLCHHVTQQKAHDMVIGGDRKGIEGFSFHNIENAF